MITKIMSRKRGEEKLSSTGALKKRTFAGLENSCIRKKSKDLRHALQLLFRMGDNRVATSDSAKNRRPKTKGKRASFLKSTRKSWDRISAIFDGTTATMRTDEASKRSQLSAFVFEGDSDDEDSDERETTYWDGCQNI